MRRQLIGLLAGALLASGTAVATADRGHDKKHDREFDIQAHRGGRAVLPENILAAG